MAEHVAIKCTYNNGDEGLYVGFNGTCSDGNIKRNIEGGRVWCSQGSCECRKYYDGGFEGVIPTDPCYESVLFRDCKYGAGWYHNGEKAGTPKHLRNVIKGKIAILITRFPDDEEIDRKIIGFFKIAQVTNNPGEETILIADKSLCVRLSMEEAKELYFWDYYTTYGGAVWGTLLIRYLNDSQFVNILTDLKHTLRDEKAKAIVTKILSEDFQNVAPAPPSGPRIEISGNRATRVSTVRKYGPGGEGEEHKKLKEWIAKNPTVIGLDNVQGVGIEYTFISGDAADIVFKLADNRYAVVEIETTDPLPGCHQVLKYKVLKCAEISEDIKASNVEAILVAWSVPPESRDFCGKYSIRWVEKKLA